MPNTQLTFTVVSWRVQYLNGSQIEQSCVCLYIVGDVWATITAQMKLFDSLNFVRVEVFVWLQKQTLIFFLRVRDNSNE